MFIFDLNVVFTTDFLKMAAIRVRFSLGFPPGAVFHWEEFAQACFARHARAVKNGAFSTEAAAALACFSEVEFHGEECSGILLEPCREDNFTGRNRFYVYSWVGQLIQHGAFLSVIVSNHAGANSSP
jgi:hypothetical protein